LASNSEDTNFILLTGIWVVIALALYLMRPNPARTQEETIKKLPFGGSDNSGSDVWVTLKPIKNILNINNNVFIFRIHLPRLLHQWEPSDNIIF